MTEKKAALYALSVCSSLNKMEVSGFGTNWMKFELSLLCEISELIAVFLFMWKK